MHSKPFPVPQSNPPRSPRETLPTMYDLPSEDPEESGLPDEFHNLQPQLLSETLRLKNYARDRTFTGTDLNLYFDVRQPLWHKRPDWFLVLGVPRLYDEVDLRASYVVWQEGVNPFMVIELLSPGTAKEDLGAFVEEEVNLDEDGDDVEERFEGNGQTLKEKPPRKWKVYEQILRVPYYVVFSRYTNRLRFFKLMGARYQEQTVDAQNPRLWVPELELGLGLWQGEYDGISRSWLRWYDDQDNWVPTDAEQLEQERQRASQAEMQLRQVVTNLVQQGLTVEQIATLTGLSEAEVQQLS